MLGYVDSMERRRGQGLRRLLQSGAAVCAGALLVLALGTQPAQAQFDNDYTSMPAGNKVTGMVLDSEADVQLSGADDVVWFSFTPQTDGKYTFESADPVGDPYGALYRPATLEEAEEEGAELVLVRCEDDYGDELDFRIVAKLEGGVTYYLACSSCESEDAYKVVVGMYDDSNLAEHDAWAGRSRVPTGTAVTFDALGVCVVDDYIVDDDESDVATYLSADTDYKFSSWLRWDDDEGGYVPLQAAPTEAGEYGVRLEGVGSYAGTLDVSFYIYDRSDLSSLWELDCRDIYADTPANANTLKLQVRMCDEEVDEFTDSLKAGTDYSISGWYELKRVYDYEDESYAWDVSAKTTTPPSKPGKYRVEVQGKGAYHGTITCDFDIYDPADISAYSVYQENDRLWASNATASLGRLGVVLYRVHAANRQLRSGVDYGLAGWRQGKELIDEDGDSYMEYTDMAGTPKTPGYYEAVLRGKGTCKGEALVTFEIADPYDMDNYFVDSNHYIAADGKQADAGKLNVQVYRVQEDGTVVTLVAGRDYEIAGWAAYDEEENEYVPVTQSTTAALGEYQAYLKPKGSYKGGEVPAWFMVCDPTQLENAYMDMGERLYLVGETPNVNPVLVTLDGKRLSRDKDYTLAIEKWDENKRQWTAAANTTAAGVYRMEANAVSGSGYGGSCIAFFAVLADADREALSTEEYFIDGIASSYAYTGKALTPVPVVRSMEDYGDWLASGYQYSVSYAGNVTGPKATLTVTGQRMYKGTLSTSFAVTNTPQAVGSKVVSGKNSFCVTKSGTSPELAFTGSSASGMLSIPASVKSRGVNYKVTSIAARAFKGNKKVVKLNVPDSVTSIGASAFEKATRLKSVTLGTGITSMGKGVFKGAKKLKTVTVKSGKLGKTAVKNMVKGSKIKSIKLSGGAAKKMKKKYNGWSGKKVKVK